MVLTPVASSPGGYEKMMSNGVTIFFVGFWIGIGSILAYPFLRKQKERPSLIVWFYAGIAHTVSSIAVICFFLFVVAKNL